jgi:hypothetical protein
MDQKLWGNEFFWKSLARWANTRATKQELTTCRKKCGHEEEGEFCIQGVTSIHAREAPAIVCNLTNCRLLLLLATPFFPILKFFYLNFFLVL